MKRKTIHPLLKPLALAAVVAAHLVLAGALGAQVSLNLQDVRIETDRLAPGLTDGQAVFVIDDATRIEIDIVSTLADLVTQVEAPTGEILDESSIAGFGGEFVSFSGSASPDSPLLTPRGQPGTHFIFRFPSLGSGSYTVRFSADPALAEAVAVITQLTTLSPVGVALIATNPEVVAGDSAVLTAAVFEGAQPLTGISVEVSLRDPDGSYSILTLLDNGLDGDDAAGDGLYSVEFQPQAPGEYGAVAHISGTTPGGTAFVRQAATAFGVIAESARLTGDFLDFGVDDNNNGLFDRLVIEADVQALVAGDYRLFVGLETAGGNTLVATGDGSLVPGLGSLTADFSADDIVGLAEDGPYDVTVLELVLVEAARLTPADRLIDVGQTQAFLLSQFQRPGLSLTGVADDQAFDDDGNGLFDRLVVSVEVEVLKSGFYAWSLKLTDQDLNEIDFVSRSGFLSAGVSIIDATFQGQKIGESGADGPYLLRDLLMFGAGSSLVVTAIGETQPYLNRQFEGATPQDTTPPTIEVEVDPSRLWPPNHQLVAVAVSVTVSDDQDPNPSVELIAILSNEGDDGVGDGNTADDIQEADFGTDDREFLLRAERSGLGQDRVYTITYEARDAAGNAAQATATVTVPHDQRSE